MARKWTFVVLNPFLVRELKARACGPEARIDAAARRQKSIEKATVTACSIEAACRGEACQ